VEVQWVQRDAAGGDVKEADRRDAAGSDVEERPFRAAFSSTL